MNNQLTPTQAMYHNFLNSPLTVEETASRILGTRKITPRDKQSLMSALLGENLGEEDCTLIDRILYGARRGILRVID